MKSPEITDRTPARSLERRVQPGSGQRWLWITPLLAMILLVAVMLILFWALRRDEIDRQQQQLYRDVQWTQQVMRLRMLNNQDEIIALAREIGQSNLVDAPHFRALARQFMTNTPEIVMIARLDTERAAHWSASADPRFDLGYLEENDFFVNPEQNATFDGARDSRLPVYSRPFPGPDSDFYVELQTPIYSHGHFAGTVSAIYSVVNIARYVVPHESIEKYGIAMVDENGAQLVGRASSPGGEAGLYYDLALDPPGHGLYLRATSYRIRSDLAQNFLVWAVVALSLFILWSLWSLMRHNRRRLEAESARDRLFNLSLDMLCIMDERGELQRVSPACRHVLGREPEDLRGCSLLDIVHPDDRGATSAELHKLRTGKPSTAFENRCRRFNADGSTEYRWLMWTFNPDPHSRTAMHLLYAVAHDVTLRRARQQALVAETTFRRAMEDALLTGMRAIDMDGRITYVNKSFCRMLGYDEQDLLNKEPPYPYWPPQRDQQNRTALADLLAGRAPASGLEVLLQRKDGSQLDARMYVSPLLNEDGVQTGWMTSITDITEPKRIRQELASAHERFTTVLEELDAAVSVYGGSADGDQLLFANRYYRRLFGTGALGHRELSEAVGGRGQDAEAPLAVEVHSESVNQWFEVRERPIQWVDGRMVQMQVATDITVRKATEELVRQQQEKVQLTSRLITMGEMASSLAHELNQPLTAIANYSMGTVARVRAAIEQGERSDPAELLETLQKTSAQAERAGNIIRRIREFVRRREPHRRPVSIRSILDDAVGFAELEASKKRIVIRTHVATDLSDIQADPIMIEQVLLNLLKNAVDAMQNASVREIILEVREREGYIEFAVTDHGSGIAPELDSKLFEPFYSTKAEGMGMGLNICRSIIEFHHGRLWAHNNANGGCTFCFTLPKAYLANAA